MTKARDPERLMNKREPATRSADGLPQASVLKPDIPTRPRLALPRFFSIANVAAQLDVSQTTVRRLIAAGDLPVHRLGRQLRVSEPDLAGFLARSRLI